jgi:peptidoglycan/LPS O-acetylase OafA/YrhL
VRRIRGWLLAAAGLAAFTAAVMTAARTGSLPWYGIAALPVAVVGLVLAGARPRPAPPLNRNEHGQA